MNDTALNATSTREEALAEFGPDLVGAMDEVAELLFATRLLVTAMAEYQVLGIFKQAEPLSQRLERALHGVRNDLLEAVRLGSPETLADRLRQVRKANALRIAQAGKDAASLAEGEREQTSAAPAADGPGTTSDRLQHRIERIAALWATL